MKRSKLDVNLRRTSVYEEIVTEGVVDVDNLAIAHGVSKPTIRRDLQYLEDNYNICRFYGGARTMVDSALNQTNQSLAKTRIAKKAAEFVEDGDTIFVNSSSTAIAMLQYITAKDVTVITNNANAINVEHNPKIKIVLTGGERRQNSNAMIGSFAITNLNNVTAKKSFLGCTALNFESGTMTEELDEVYVNRLMVTRVAGDIFFLAESSKIGKNSSFVSCSITRLKNLITDEGISKEMIYEAKTKGINLHITSKLD